MQVNPVHHQMTVSVHTLLLLMSQLLSLDMTLCSQDQVMQIMDFQFIVRRMN